MRQLRHATLAWLCLAALCALAPAMSAQAISGNSSSYPAYPSITSSPLTVDASYQPGSIEPLFNMTNYFLNVVQPRAWPSDLIGTDFSKISQNLQALVKEVALYEVGFIVCALIGIIFIVFMPIVGFFFCVCRCCLNCGGEMHQREKDITPCRRHTFGTFLAIVTIIMLAGIACAFATNEQTTTSMKKLPKLMTDNLRDLATFISDIPKVDPTPPACPPLRVPRGNVGTTLVQGFKPHAPTLWPNVAFLLGSATVYCVGSTFEQKIISCSRKPVEGLTFILSCAYILVFHEVHGVHCRDCVCVWEGGGYPMNACESAFDSSRFLTVQHSLTQVSSW